MTVRLLLPRTNLPPDVVEELLRGARAGVDYRVLALNVGCVLSTVYRVLGAPADRPVDRRATGRLTLGEREEIRVSLGAGASLRAIARAIDRHHGTVAREVANNGGREHYRAYRADERALRLTRRPRASKLEANAPLRAEVELRLSERWSPQQISDHLRRSFAHDASMHVSHETIYQSLFVQTRGSLRKELTAYLRTGRTRRKPHGRQETRGKITNMISIRERPAEADDRAVPGHWEGDLILGRHQRSAIGTLVERSTRFVMLLELPHGRTAEAVRTTLARQILTLPEALRRSLTWDQGKELAEHQRFTIDTGVQVYFCDPHSPWQRGSNENTNGLLRQYFPKGTDLSVHDQSHLDAVADELNRRPRKTLGGMPPAEAYTAAVAMTN